jgi:hypothetical protein
MRKFIDIINEALKPTVLTGIMPDWGDIVLLEDRQRVVFHNLDQLGIDQPQDSLQRLKGACIGWIKEVDEELNEPVRYLCEKDEATLAIIFAPESRGYSVFCRKPTEFNIVGKGGKLGLLGMYIREWMPKHMGKEVTGETLANLEHTARHAGTKLP